MNDTCRECVNWNACPLEKRTDLYFQPGDIKYCRVQTLFLLAHWDFLEAYQYPPDFRITGYNDMPMVSGSSSQAPFQLAADIHMEIEVRAESVKHYAIDRWRLLIAEAMLGYKYNDLSSGARSVLNFISGRRKRMGYRQWIKQKNYREAKWTLQKST